MVTAVHPIKACRLENNLTLDAFGKQIGVTGLTVWRWENLRRQPRKRALDDIKAKFGIAPSEIVNFEPARSEP